MTKAIVPKRIEYPEEVRKCHIKDQAKVQEYTVVELDGEPWDRSCFVAARWANRGTSGCRLRHYCSP